MAQHILICQRRMKVGWLNMDLVARIVLGRLIEIADSKLWVVVHIRYWVSHIFCHIVVGNRRCRYHPHIRVALGHLALLRFAAVLNHRLRLWLLVHCALLGFRKRRRWLGPILLLAVHKCVCQGLRAAHRHSDLAHQWAFQWDLIIQEFGESNKLEWLYQLTFLGGG